MSEWEWLHRFIACGGNMPQGDIEQAHDIVNRLTAENERLQATVKRLAALARLRALDEADIRLIDELEPAIDGSPRCQ